MRVHVFGLPYDSGTRATRMGLGPLHLLDAGLESRVREAGHEVVLELLEVPTSPLTPEPRVAFELNRQLADRLGTAVRDGKFPVVLAGSCYSAVGSVAGLGPARTGVVWFDSHADFNTPDTTVTGFLDGMALAILTGRCWSQLAGGVPGFGPVPDQNVCLLAARDLDGLEAERLERSEIIVLSPERVLAELDSSLRLLSARVEQLYIHIDLDVLDPSEGCVNELAAPGGLTLEDTVAALRTAGQVSRIGGVALTAYDPALDEDGKVCGAAFTLLDTVLEVVAAARSGND